MSNYYYVREEDAPCECCGRGVEQTRKHIGKKSFKYCFSLHVYPDEGIHDLEDWVDIWNDCWHGKGKIEDECGNKVSREEMLREIIGRRPGRRRKGHHPWDEKDVAIYKKGGARGLQRNEVDGEYCIKNGKGPWDCIVGYFC